MRKALFLILFASRFAPFAIAQKVDVASLDTLFSRLERNQKLMGSVLISKNGKTLYGRGFGQSQVGQLTAVNNTINTVYRIGSITKMFTATMVMQLVQEKRLKLTDTLARWFPQIPNAEKITLDQMLTHHSGIHNFTEDTAFMPWQDTVKSSAAILSHIASFPSDFEPGSKAAYSNSNFVLLGYIIEAVTGMPYAQVLQNRITRPLKLTQTGFGARTIRPEAGEALPFAIEEGHWVAVPPSSTDVAGGAGGIVSTVGDMAKFIEALMTRHFLQDTTLKKMMELKDRYGRGLVKFPFYDRVAYGHNGHIDNFTSTLAFFPKDSTVVSIVCNGVNYVFNDALIGLLSIYFGKPYTMPEFGKKAALTEAQLKRVEGVYTTTVMPMEITVTATPTGIMAQATSQSAFPLEPVSETEFANDEVGIHLEFSGGAAPAEKMMVLQGGSRIPFTRKK